MKTKELLEIIGEPVGSAVISGKYGDATLHKYGYVSADPCYIEHAIDAYGGYNHIRQSMRKAYPWEGYDYKAHRGEWHQFNLGHPVKDALCWYRDCSDGTGYFGNGVDAGCVVVIPLAWLPKHIQHLFNS